MSIRAQASVWIAAAAVGLAGCEAVLGLGGDTGGLEHVEGIADSGTSSSADVSMATDVGPGIADSATAHDASLDQGAADTLADSTLVDSGGPTACIINGTTVASGTPNPDDGCQSCRPSVSTAAWSDDIEGTSCGSGGICHTGMCVSGCAIGGVFYANNAAQPGNTCQTCQPGSTTSGWSNVADETSCAGGSCCGGSCVNEQSDPNNCSACGKACTAGPGPGCNGALCNYTLVSGLEFPLSIAYASGLLVWVDPSGSILSAPLTGGPTTTVASGMPGIFSIATYNGRIYWRNDQPPGIVGSVQIDGGSPTTLWDGGPTYSTNMAAAFGNVYWTTTTSTAVTPDYIFRLPTSGGTPTVVASALGPSHVLYNVAADSVSVYAEDYGSIVKVGIGGGTPSAIAPTGISDAIVVSGIAVDSSNVYWAESSEGVVMKVGLDGGAPTTLASGQDNPTGLALDLTNVYWVNDDTPGAVMTVPIVGGTPRVLASGQSSPNSLLVAGDNVYWANFGPGGLDAGTIMMAPTTPH